MAAIALIPASAFAQANAPAPETVTVIATSPLPGTGIDVDKLPNVTQTVTRIEYSRGLPVRKPRHAVQHLRRHPLPELNPAPANSRRLLTGE